MTQIIRVDPTHPDATLIALAAECLRDGGLVAFPTETVYGLGAHALDREAIRRLFAAKQRPANDPLIVHVVSVDDVAPLVDDIPDSARALAARFWPGPLTMVLRRSSRVPDEVTAGLNTVAVRVPSHPVARALIEAARIPVAAPSANLFSRPSPTVSAHVLADLEGRIDLIVDGGPTEVGVESTVIDLSGSTPVVLRPGVIDLHALRSVIPTVIARNARAPAGEASPSPGMMAKHYSPRAPLMLFGGPADSACIRMVADTARIIGEGRTVTAVALDEDGEQLRAAGARIIELGSETTPSVVASRLYAALREADETSPDVIVARLPTTTHPLTAAIEDRLRRAAAGYVPCDSVSYGD